ncbi:MAG: hypothetical protein WED07_16245 [Candidatus Freyarchaeum deiterrae]
MVEVEVDKVWLFQWFLQIAGRIQKILGKNYMRIALRHMGNYLYSRTGKRPSTLETVDSFRDYGLQVIDKIEDPWNAVLYGFLEADRDYRASMRSGEDGFNKVVELVLDASLVGKECLKISDIYDATQKCFEYLNSIRVDVHSSYQKVDSETLNLTVSNCLYKDCCRTVQAEELFRDDGTPLCWILKMNCSGISRLSEKRTDYRLLEFDMPDCRGILLKL